MITIHALRVTYAWFVNYCYVIANTMAKTAVIVDPAWEIDTIESTLQSLTVTPQGILLTHSHYDHINLADVLAKKYQIPVYMSRQEIDYYSFKCTQLVPMDNFAPLSLGDIQIQPILTPGHTFGGTSYLIHNNLFCGDTIFIEGCGICAGKGADPKAMFETLQYLKKTISPQTLIYPGHCYGTPVGQSFEYVLKNNIYLQFEQCDRFITYRMRKNQKNMFNFL